MTIGRHLFREKKERKTEMTAVFVSAKQQEVKIK